MNYVALKAYIDADQTLASLLPQQRDGEIAEILNLKNQRGPIPTEEFSGWAFDLGIVGPCEAVVAIGLTASSTTDERSLFGLCKQFLNTISLDKRSDIPTINIDNPAVQAGITTFKALGWISTETEAFINALGNNRRSVAQVQFGRDVKPEDIAIADSRQAKSSSVLVSEVGRRTDLGSFAVTSPELLSTLNAIDAYFTANSTAINSLFNANLTGVQRSYLLSVVAANRLGGQ